ncbi:Modification methylase MjaI [uncultured archaeon]|nr:Modification methylase MjaI [uncultured archaeon]
MTTTHYVYFQDSQSMPQVKSQSMQLMLTSCPYGTIKDYGNPDQIGFYDSIPEYYRKLGNVWTESIRALCPGGRMCINIGDQYVRAVKGTPYQILPLHAYLVSDIMAHHSDNLVYLGSIIWQKIPNTKTTGGASVMGSYPYPRNGYVSYNFEYIAIFKKLGKDPRPSKEIKAQAKMTKEEWRKLFNGIWQFNGVRQIDHIAVFPDELARRLIRMFTFPGDNVLDTFLGSGTTAKVAYEDGRNSIGYELGFGSGIDYTREVIKKKIHFYDVPVSESAAIFPTLV